MTDSAVKSASLRELTLRGVILGALITIVFTAANIYLGLKVGLTFASSIPAAVISMVVLRFFGGTTVLENNIVQTQASAAGTLSSIIFVIPGLIMVGHWKGFPWLETAGICAAGGILGVLFTIPLRRALIIDSALPFPEGVAAAEVLKVGDSAASGGARQLATGGIVAALFSLFSTGFGLLADSVSGLLTTGGAVFKLSADLSLALVGAGYLMGIRAGLALIVGLIISWGVFVPYFTATTHLPDGSSLSAFAQSLWSHKVRLIGAGTIAIAAIWTLGALIPSIAGGLSSALAASRGPSGAGIERTDRDMSMGQILIVMAVALAALFVVFLLFAGVDHVGLAFVAALWAAILGFVVAAACGYMAGLVGSSSSPISGVGIIAVILTSLGLLALPAGASPLAIPIALFVTSAVVAMGCISNDNLQDLKTGYLVSATPAMQQIALIIGCLVGAAVIPPLLELLYQAYGFAGALPRPGMDPNLALAAPQATLMSALATGVLGHQIDWNMIAIGLAIGVVLIVVDLILKATTTSARLPPLAVGMGIYLPSGVIATLVIGAILSWIANKSLAGRPREEQAAAENRGVLLASGFIVGESLIGVAMAAVIGATGNQTALTLVGAGYAPIATILGAVLFILICVAFVRAIAKPA